MKTIIKTCLSIAIFATSLISTVETGNAQNMNADKNARDRYIGKICDNRRNNNDCRDWRNNNGNWNNDRYQVWYRNNHSSNDRTGALLFGFAAGTLLGGVVGQTVVPRYTQPVTAGWTMHFRACTNRYRSYNPNTDSFFGYDGRHHRCML